MAASAIYGYEIRVLESFSRYAVEYTPYYESWAFGPWSEAALNQTT